MSHWNYRVLHRRVGSDQLGWEDEFAVYEVYYDDAGEPVACSIDPTSPHGETLGEALEDARRYVEAFDKPTLDHHAVISTPHPVGS